MSKHRSDGTGNNGNKVPDISALDVYGNAVACKCADGFIIETNACSTGALQSGACSGDNIAMTGSESRN